MEKIYFIFCNGKPLKSVSDVNEPVKISTEADNRFYRNRKVSFTIQELINGKKMDGVAFDADNNVVKVELKALPVKKLYQVQIMPISHTSFFKTQKDALNVYLKKQKLLLDDELRFTLIGKDNDINVNDLRVEYNGDNSIIVTGAELVGQTLNVSTQSVIMPIKLPVTMPTSEIQESCKKESKPEAERAVRLVCTSGKYQEYFDQKFDAANQQPLTVKIGCGDHLLKTNIKFATEEVGLGKKGKKIDRDKVLLQAVVPLPSDWKDSLSVEITDGKTVYFTENEVWLRNGVAEVNFSQLKKKKIGIAKSIKAALIALIIGLVVGLAIGNWIGWWSGEKTDDNSAVSDTIQTETFSEGENYGTPEEYSSESVDVNAQLASFKTVLSSENKDLSFEEVAKLYNEYEQNAELFQKADPDFCKMIESYHKVQEAFDNSEIDQLKKLKRCVEYGNKEMSLYEVHRRPVATYFDVSKSRNKTQELQFRKEYLIAHKAQIKTFSDFKVLNERFKKEHGQQKKKNGNSKSLNKFRSGSTTNGESVLEEERR